METTHSGGTLSVQAMVKHGRYPNYAPSGSPWFGELPAHWKIRRLKFVATPRPSNLDKKSIEGELPVRLCNYVDVYKNEYITPDIDFMTATAGPAELNKFRLRFGDVLITKDSEEWNDIAVPAIVTEDFDDVACGYHLTQIRAHAGMLESEFLFRAFQASGVAEQYHIAAKGVTRYGISAGAIGNAVFPLPPIEEQKSIAGFLRSKVSRIDALIAKKQTLIDRLKEKRSALISQAVTRGLGLTVPMKSSCIDWLGDIPKHWEVKRLKYLLAKPLKYGANEAAELDDPELPRYVRITDIDESDGLRDETFKSLPTEVAAEYLLKEGDLLFARSGATTGKTFLYRSSWGTCAYAGYLIRARFDRREVVPRFVRYFTASANYWQWLTATTIQATIQNVSAERYANLWVPTPPLGEQAAISSFLDQKTARIDSLSAKIVSAIERLQEYRSALITAAATGKIDVRGS